MFIEFSLGEGVGSLPAYQKLELIKEEIKNWSVRYDIPYTQKTIKHTHRLAFDQDRYYTVFATTWTSNLEYRIIDRRW